MATTNARIQFSTDSLDTWTSINPTLREGEPVLAKTNDGKYALYAGNIGGSLFTESVLIWDDGKAQGILDGAEAAAAQAGVYRDEIKTYTDGAVKSAKEAADSAEIATTAAADAKTTISTVKTTAKEVAANADRAETAATKAASSESVVAASAEAAASSEKNAKTIETNVGVSEINARTYASNAKTSETNAKTSETNAKASETASAESESNAKTSEINAKASAEEVKASEESAKESRTAAAASASEASTYLSSVKENADAAKESETAAKTSETNAKASETRAVTAETNAKTSETNAASSEANASASAILAGERADSIKGDVEKAAASASAAKVSEENAAASLASAQEIEKEVEAALVKVVGAAKYAGSVANYSDLPTNPQAGDMWNVQNEDIEHRINAGDNVIWIGTAWDNLSGFVDLSDYPTNSDVAKAVMSTTYSNDTITFTHKDASTSTVTVNNVAHATSSDTATKATTADTATKATQDADGNVISNTYAKTENLSAVATSGAYSDLSGVPTNHATYNTATVGGTENPVYLNNGVITACDIATDAEIDAIFE